MFEGEGLSLMKSLNFPCNSIIREEENLNDTVQTSTVFKLFYIQGHKIIKQTPMDQAAFKVYRT